MLPVCSPASMKRWVSAIRRISQPTNYSPEIGKPVKPPPCFLAGSCTWCPSPAARQREFPRATVSTASPGMARMEDCVCHAELSTSRVEVSALLQPTGVLDVSVTLTLDDGQRTVLMVTKGILTVPHTSIRLDRSDCQ